MYSKVSCLYIHIYACMHAQLLQHVQLFAVPWTEACQAPLSMGFSRQEYWSGLPCPPPGNLPNPGIKPASPVTPALQTDSLPTEPPEKPPHTYILYFRFFFIIGYYKILYIISCAIQYILVVYFIESRVCLSDFFSMLYKGTYQSHTCSTFQQDSWSQAPSMWKVRT